ncbi:hypothetical protein WR25_03321 [Diploscapter pachys]|uniref:F-box domain-containing protein n=1 Tax=Diploscapter pachys TaxID=2018661 RepID=A0A2A2L3T3_9BILA|nr:hypothetical protein WR25_03321 [Diploscapter pachys]
MSSVSGGSNARTPSSQAKGGERGEAETAMQQQGAPGRLNQGKMSRDGGSPSSGEYALDDDIVMVGREEQEDTEDSKRFGTLASTSDLTNTSTRSTSEQERDKEKAATPRTSTDEDMAMDCENSTKELNSQFGPPAPTRLLADLSLCESDRERHLGASYLQDAEKFLDQFQKWNEEEQMDLMEKMLPLLGHFQLGRIDEFIRPMLQRDFISNLPPNLAELIMGNVDATTLTCSEQVSHNWRSAIAGGQMWKKLIEANVRADNLWRGLAEKRKWRKYVLVSRDAAAQLICEKKKLNFDNLKGTYELMILMHKFYRSLYPHIVNDIQTIENNWRTGNFNLYRINCRSENSKGVYCLQYDDEKIVSGLRDNTIKIWDRKDLSCTRVLTGHTGSVLCLQYDNRVIVSGSSDATVRVWDVHTGELLNTMIHHIEAVLHLRFSDGVMVTCSKDRSIAVWDMVSPREINMRRVLVGHRAAVNVVDFDDRYIVSASGDRTIKVWSADSLEFVRTLSGHKRGIACLQYRGRLVVSGSSDNTIRLWDIHSGLCLRVLEGHEELVRCIRFDEKRIVSGAYDGKIKVWDLQAALDPRISSTALCLSTLVQHTGRVFRLQFDDFQIVSSSHDDTILIWDFLDATPGQNSAAAIAVPQIGPPNAPQAAGPQQAPPPQNAPANAPQPQNEQQPPNGGAPVIIGN